MDGMDAWTASSLQCPPDDTAAALQLLKVLEDCGQMHFVEAEAWRWRIMGWAWFNQVGAEAAANG